MLRTFICALIICATMAGAFAQRYLDNGFFSNVKTTNGVLFGSNIEVGGTNQQELYMDVYEPDGDTAAKRPIIFMAFGGSFTSGARDDIYLPIMGNYFAKLGYVAVSIDYRTGVFSPDPNNPQNSLFAVMRGIHDMKAAIRYFKKDAATDNNWRIDPQKVIVGGVSAGSIIAVNLAYMDDESKVPSYVNQTTFDNLGGLEGKSGNPGYDTEIAAVFNLSGVVADTLWIEPGDQPCISFHESGDNVVPYDTRIIETQGTSTGLLVSGSKDMHIRFENVGIPNDVTIYPYATHVIGYMVANQTEVLNGIRDFMYDNVASKTFTTSINDVKDSKANVVFYPNPIEGNLSIINNEQQAMNISIYSVLGQRITGLENVQPGRANINLHDLKPGMYFISFEDSDNRVLSTSKLMVK